MRKRSYGYIKIKISQNTVSKAMNSIIRNNIFYKSISFSENNDAEIIISSRFENDFRLAFNNSGINAEFSSPFGILERISRYFCRAGFFIGAFFMVTCIFLSSFFVWNIKIDGAENISEKDILKTLEESGFSLGTFIPNIDYDKLHNQILLNSSDISWISVNIDGNVANVKVRENKKESQNTVDAKYVNVVAKYDAQIALVQLFNGKKAVNVGDIVKKGDLLISGIINSKSEGIRYVHASGEVKAYVNKPIEIKIPFSSTEIRYTGHIYRNKNIKIFSKIINFLPKYRNSASLCDTIERNRRLTLFGSVQLPIEVCETMYREYEYINVHHTPSEAIDMAFSKLRIETDKALENAELISKTVETSYDEEYFYIYCNLYCLEDIAMEVSFEAGN